MSILDVVENPLLFLNLPLNLSFY